MRHYRPVFVPAPENPYRIREIKSAQRNDAIDKQERWVPEVRYFMRQPSDDNKLANTRKPYEKPTITQLTREQAKLKLIGHTMAGNQGAKELLQLLEDSRSRIDSNTEKKSA